MKASIKMPSPAMLVALVALFVALGGSAYAVNAIGTNQIKNGAVTTPKLANNAVTTAKVSSGAIARAKIRDGAVGPDQIGSGALGSQVEFVDQSRIEGIPAQVMVDPSGYAEAAVSCPQGQTMIYASWRPLIEIVNPQVVLVDTDQYEVDTFRMKFYNPSANPQLLGMWGLCI